MPAGWWPFASRVETGLRSRAASGAPATGTGPVPFWRSGAANCCASIARGKGSPRRTRRRCTSGSASAEEVTRLEIEWPSGRRSDTTAVPAGTLVTAYEDPSQSPTGAPFVLTPYRASRPAASRSPRPPKAMANVNAVNGPNGSIRAAQDVLPGERARLILYTTVATWCAPCLAELPSLNLLRSSFTSAELEIFGVPYDPEESPEVLAAWSARYEATISHPLRAETQAARCGDSGRTRGLAHRRAPRSRRYRFRRRGASGALGTAVGLGAARPDREPGERESDRRHGILVARADSGEGRSDVSRRSSPRS